MNRKGHAWAIVLILLLGVSSSGCALFLIGVGAVGGYAIIAEDEIEGTVKTKYDKMWERATDIIGRRGTPIIENKGIGKIEADVEGSKVEINITRVNFRTVRLRVKARKDKGVFPDMTRAKDIYNEIIQP